MFKHLSLTFVILFLMIANATAQEQGGIVWEKDYKTALAKARETGRPLMIDFWAEWCKPCIAMDKNFWILPEVATAVKPFIAVKLDFDDEQGLASKYGVSAIPNVVFTDPLGNIVTSRKGFSSGKIKELNQIFDEMPKDFSALLPLYDALDQKKNDGEALLKIADAYRAHKMLMLSNDFYKRALKDDLIKNDAEKHERIVTTMGVNSYKVGDYKSAVDSFDDLLKGYPQTKNREPVLAMTSIAYANLGKKKDHLKYLEMLKQEFPSSTHIATAQASLEEAKAKQKK